MICAPPCRCWMIEHGCSPPCPRHGIEPREYHKCPDGETRGGSKEDCFACSLGEALKLAKEFSEEIDGP